MPRRNPTVNQDALDTIGSRAPKRDRSYEQDARDRGIVVTYRGIPKELHEDLKRIAVGLGVPVGELARAFLEHSLADYESGALSLTTAETVTKSTLYPGDSVSGM